jgi:3-carboxy-cis,cis-muconate cycloisomerase
MMALAPRLGRGRAHELVMGAAREADERGVELAAVLRERGELTDEALDRLLDPLAYLGESGRVVDDTLRAGGGNGRS